VKRLSSATALGLTYDNLPVVSSISPTFATPDHFSSLNILQQNMIPVIIQPQRTSVFVFHLQCLIDLRWVL
jgi:hypothetical protein